MSDGGMNTLVVLHEQLDAGAGDRFKGPRNTT